MFPFLVQEVTEPRCNLNQLDQIVNYFQKIGIAKNILSYYPVGVNTISLKLPDRLLKLLEAECRVRRTTKSSLVRESLEKALAGRPPGGEASCYDLARDLAGSVKGLPRDLATNPKYLEGFGG